MHGIDDAAQTAGADYVIAGTLFPSDSKGAGRTLLGLDALRAVVQAVGVPVLAIGGISEARFDEVAATGAGGIAAIGLFMTPEALGPEPTRSSCRAMPLLDIVERARTRFGRVQRASEGP